MPYLRRRNNTCKKYLEEKKLTILAVKRYSERRTSVSRTNLHFYLEDMIDLCEGCFICSHPKTVGALGLRYIFSRAVKEIEYFIATIFYTIFYYIYYIESHYILRYQAAPSKHKAEVRESRRWGIAAEGRSEGCL